MQVSKHIVVNIIACLVSVLSLLVSFELYGAFENYQWWCYAVPIAGMAVAFYSFVQWRKQL